MIKKLFCGLLIVMGLIGIAATAMVIPVSTSIGLGTVFPAAVGVVLIAYGVIRLKHPAPIIKSKPLRIVVTAVVCLGILSFLVVEALVVIGAQTAYQDRDADFVIVLGAGIYPDGQLSLMLKNRLDVSLEYLNEHEEAVCIVSGGQGPSEPEPAAEAMKAYLVSMGVGASRIVVEPNAADTYDNMALSARIMQDYPDREKTAAIVTSDYHIFRSMLLAEEHGIDAFALPAPTPWYLVINSYMREYLGVVKMVLFK